MYKINQKKTEKLQRFKLRDEKINFKAKNKLLRIFSWKTFIPAVNISYKIGKFNSNKISKPPYIKKQYQTNKNKTKTKEKD